MGFELKASSAKKLIQKGFKADRCKTSLKLTMARIKLLKNKKAMHITQMRREISQLLANEQDETARIRVILLIIILYYLPSVDGPPGSDPDPGRSSSSSRPERVPADRELPGQPSIRDSEIHGRVSASSIHASPFLAPQTPFLCFQDSRPSPSPLPIKGR